MSDCEHAYIEVLFLSHCDPKALLIEVPEDAPQHFKTFSNTGECYIVLGKSTSATFFPMGKNRFAVGIGFDDKVQAEFWHLANVNPCISWTNLDAMQKQKIAELLAVDCSFQDNMLIQAFQWVPDWDAYKIYLWKMRDSDVATCPYNQYGNIIMIGDAAHAIMPTIGMGASLAIEDAEILGQQLAEHIQQGNPNFKKVLEKYAALRVPIWKDLMARARAGAKLNFIGIKHKSRLSIGPQVPGRIFWRIVAKIEEFIG